MWNGVSQKQLLGMAQQDYQVEPNDDEFPQGMKI